MKTETTIWTRTGNDFVTDMSAAAHVFDPSSTCPKCKAELSLSEVAAWPAHDSENEITRWNGRCICGAFFTVFND